MAKNNNLTNAKKAKNDEFYTRLTDIEKELYYHRPSFYDKVVYCNCDDPERSKFWYFFMKQFDILHLKRLICTCWVEGGHGKHWEISRNEDGTMGEIRRYTLESDGSFDSDECKTLLSECDIVCTNPPFSKFREYVALLVEADKKFLILGNLNAITYKEIFPLIKENKLWTGHGFNQSLVYLTPYPNTLEANRKFVQGKGLNPDDGYVKVPATCWFCNLPVQKNNEELILYKNYTPEEYPTYDNYDAINVDKVCDIPCDYYGVIGVPITFLDKYNPTQFELIDEETYNRERERESNRLLSAETSTTEFSQINPNSESSDSDTEPTEKISSIQKTENKSNHTSGSLSNVVKYGDKYMRILENQSMFRIVGISDAESSLRMKTYEDYIGYNQLGEKTGRTGSTFGACPVLTKNDGKTVFYKKDDHVVQATYCRIFIQRISEGGTEC